MVRNFRSMVLFEKTYMTEKAGTESITPIMPKRPPPTRIAKITQKEDWEEGEEKKWVKGG